ncbi:hypothetical protein C7450_1249 [Chelatococcus asaccharovorans]|uniref:DUF7065 domain-containing protein n=2 Tax=Chelatococcus asaccharovorans TaxID=28210 RepID=A0A2V3TQJ4_9HYPH|nr:hypothetical protein C7450_1249 [Chelatococcus asaccharovorans]
MTDESRIPPVITERDDRFHFDEMSDRWWITETAWFSFCKPEIGLGGWIYTMARPNIGTVAGGAWLWDASAHLPWEVLYSRNLTALRLPQEQDLDDIALPTGARIRTIEPLTSYELNYEEEGMVSMDLRFDAVMPPRPLAKAGSSFQKLSHFDQFGRVHGRIQLHEREIDIDCLAMRDRSWGPRPEHRPGRSAYVTGIASPNDAFLAVTKWNDPDYAIAYGFQIRDGEAADLLTGRRWVERDSEQHWVNRIVIEAKDALGRDLLAEGRRLSGIVINRHSFIDSNGLIEWTINGNTGHGEDQDMWPVHDWAAARRHARGEK